MAEKQTGAIAGAHPTAPGGMSKANLRIELAEKHHTPMDDSRTMTWPELIEAVIQGRLAREAEAKGATRSTEPVEEIDEDDVFAMLDESVDEEPEDMFDDLAEFDTDEEPVVEHDPAFLQALAETRHEYREALDRLAEDDGPVTDDEEVFDPETMWQEMAEVYQAEMAQNPPIFLGIPGIKDYVFDGHAGAGPSASERWMNCTMSLSASRRFLETLTPNQQRKFAGANLAARQGTTAHAAAEAEANHMLGRIDDAELSTTLLDLMVTPDDEGEAYNDEMGDYITEYVDLFSGYAGERGAERILIEQRVEAAIPLAGLHEGEVYIIRGSADGIALPTEEDPVLVVGDLKYGDGIWVDVTANTQAMIYSLGVLGLLVDDEGNLITDVEKVRLHIIQPRLGGIKTWEISLDDLFDWRDDVLSPALTKALYPDEGATYEPSPSACQFCPARGGCPALAQQRLEQAAELFDVIQDVEYTEGVGETPDAEQMDDETIGNLLTQITGLVKLHKEMKAEVERRLYRGHIIPGFDLRNYSPPRKWTDDVEHSDLVKAVGAKTAKTLYTTPVLVSPPQAEQILGKEEYTKIETLVEKPDKRPVVSTGPGDRRSKWAGKAPEAMFPDHDGAEDADDSATSAERMFPDD